MPHRLHRPDLERHQRRRRSRPRGSAPWRSLYQHLVRKQDALDSASDAAVRPRRSNPGYIKGYVPGIRENGGQYTHAATWVVLAFAMLGDGDRAGEAFRMLNPINHTRSRADVQRYKVEPYVVAGDVYSEPPHVGPRRLDLVYQARRAGSIASASNPSWDSACAA